MSTRYSFLNVNSDMSFRAAAMSMLYAQYKYLPIYRQYIDLLRISVRNVNSLEQIPFLPIQFFRTHEVCRPLSSPPEKVFTSSGTTGSEISRHVVAKLGVYDKSLLTAFTKFYGDPKHLSILALLPSYLEREGSSLVYMVSRLMEYSREESGFYLDSTKNLAKLLRALDSHNRKVLLIGVSFALLDMAEHYKFKLKNTIVMETGGMKGRRAEISRSELHSKLTAAFGVQSIHSEYGMTELLSQAYSSGNGVFRCPPWMRVLVRDPSDPRDVRTTGRGALNIIDLANIYSCGFIQTDDIGEVHRDGSFEVFGRLSNAPIRGCNMLIEE